jgi:ABC-type branched-subunit amino acid transport system substrate-binding protein
MTVVIDQPSSGMFSEQNRSIAQGAQVAVDELDAAGGLAHHLRVKLVRQSLDGLSASALKSRLHAEAAAVLILPCDTNTQLSLAAAASQYGMLMLAPCNPDATAGGRYPTYWPVGMSASDEAAGLASFMGTVGYGRVFVVSAPGSGYVELLTGDFRSAIQTRGIQVVGSASIATTTKDFSSLAHTIEAAHPKPSAIFTALPPPLVNQLAEGLFSHGISQTVLGGTAMDTPLTLSSGSRALEDAVFTSYGFPRVTASARRFAAGYRRRFGRSPVGSFPGLGLETIRLITSAVNRAHSGEPSAIQRALARGIALRGVALADRAYPHGGDHNPVGTVALNKISGGSFLPLLAITPSNTPAP